MSNENQVEEIDRVLDVLTKPLSRYILSVLAGVNPGVYTGPDETETDGEQVSEESDS